MPDFKHSTPENFADGQELPPLKRMRRMDMLKLVRAYGIQHPPNANRKILEPLLEIALGAGQIGPNVTPLHPEFLLAAGDRPERVAARNKGKRDWTPDVSLPDGVLPLGLYAKWRGGAKWCVMDGENVMQKGLSKDEAIAACG